MLDRIDEAGWLLRFALTLPGSHPPFTQPENLTLAVMISMLVGAFGANRCDRMTACKLLSFDPHSELAGGSALSADSFVWRRNWTFAAPRTKDCYTGQKQTSEAIRARSSSAQTCRSSPLATLQCNFAKLDIANGAQHLGKLMDSYADTSARCGCVIDRLQAPHVTFIKR